MLLRLRGPNIVHRRWYTAQRDVRRNLTSTMTRILQQLRTKMRGNRPLISGKHSRNANQPSPQRSVPPLAIQRSRSHEIVINIIRHHRHRNAIIHPVAHKDRPVSFLINTSDTFNVDKTNFPADAPCWKYYDDLFQTLDGDWSTCRHAASRRGYWGYCVRWPTLLGCGLVEHA